MFDRAEEFFKVSCVDILANNAGVNVNLGWRKCMDINIMAVMNGTEIALERMNKAGKPCQIINTASLGTTLTFTNNFTHVGNVGCIFSRICPWC